MASDHGSPGHDHELHAVVRDNASPSTSVRLFSNEPECLSDVIAQGLQTMKTRFKASHQSQIHRYIRRRASRLSLFRRRSHFWRPRLHSWQKTKKKMRGTHSLVACMVARRVRGWPRVQCRQIHHRHFNLHLRDETARSRELGGEY
jgi:hypothetical protein